MNKKMDDVNDPETAQSASSTPSDAAVATAHVFSRAFPCESCGADLTFNIGTQSLKCQHCGHVKKIDLDPQAVVAEQDFPAMMAILAEQHGQGREKIADVHEVTCRSCAATVRFTGTLTSSECAYCGVPLQRADAHQAEQRIPVDGLLPFTLDRPQARTNLTDWTRSRWFAPNEFKRRGVQGRFSGVYLPYWTFDSLTFNHYVGERGQHYWVTVGSGKNRRSVRQTIWHPASGQFQRFFDDVLVVAGTGLPTKRLTALEPWPLHKCMPYTPAALAGLLARTYDIQLDAGFTEAQARVRIELEADVRRRIGGDEQRIHSLDTRYDAVTFKHLLLPVWMLAYRFHKKTYQVVVNATTGEVQGDRPYSWIKITLAVLAALAALATAFIIAKMT